MNEEKQLDAEQWDEQSQEEYFSPQESEEMDTVSDGDSMESNDEDNPDIYITRSGKKSKAPERLQYDVHSCLIRSNGHEQEEGWSEQHLLAYKASTDPDTMYHHQAMKQSDRE